MGRLRRANVGTSYQLVLWRLTLRLLASETQRPTPTNGSGCGRGVIIGAVEERTDCEGSAGCGQIRTCPEYYGQVRDNSEVAP
ncbi:hypothetical protein PF005_g22616, partial [Phytophthora fragariae]